MIEPTEVISVSRLKVAKLVPVLDSGGAVVHLPLNRVGTVPAADLLNPDEDPDRFYFVITDAAKRGTSPRVRVTTECTESGFESYSDSAASGDANVIELVNLGDSGAKLRTPAMILVSDDTD